MADTPLPDSEAARDAERKARKRAYKRAWREKNKERLREREAAAAREWRRRNPEKALEVSRRYEAKRRGKRLLTDEQKERIRLTARLRWAADPTKNAAKRAKTQAWKAANKDREHMRDREYRKKNTDKVAEWRATSKSRKLHIKWYAANAQKLREMARQAYWADPDKGRAATRNWVKKYPDRAKAAWAACDARRKGAAGSFSAPDIARIRASQNDRCAYCRERLKRRVHIDHITPISKGGSNYPRNLQLLCEPCNLRKHAKDPIDFAQSLGLLL